MNKQLIKSYAVIAIPLFAFGFGIALGAELGDPQAIAYKTQVEHNRQVIETVEAAAQRYSVCLSGDQNLLPDWAAEPRIPMADLDAYYRFQ